MSFKNNSLTTLLFIIALVSVSAYSKEEENDDEHGHSHSLLSQPNFIEIA